jgi:chromosome partition protein MukF
VPRPADTPPDPSSPPGSAARATLVRLAEQAPSLQLGSVDILFLAALQLRADSGALPAFSETELVEAFRDVALLSEPATENVRKRATHAIARLREQRLLVRVDGAGVTRAGDYAVTRLGAAIVRFFLDDEALTRESLSLLAESLIGTLSHVLLTARGTKGPDAMNAAVTGPLRVTVADLAQGIERRQRALDLKQEDFQRAVAALLQADWFLAIDRCQALLDETGSTLRELNEVLLRDSHRVQETLQQLRELAREAEAAQAEAAVERVSEQVDRIAAWGAARQRAWSEYHENVHGFLRDVVRLDPTRALTERLRTQLSGKSARAFSLTVANEPSTLVLREGMVVPERRPVKRPRKERDAEPERTSAEEDPVAALEAHVRRVLAQGAAGLAEVTERVVAELPENERYVLAGRVAELVARIARAEPTRERPWVPVAETFVVEEWSVEGSVEER